jgi:hypothetical protein
MKYCLYILFLIIIASNVHSQGDYLDPGQNGFLVSVGYFSDKCRHKGITGEIGISTKGIFDISLNGGRFTSAGNDKTKTWIVNPKISLYFIKSDINNSTLVVSLSAGFQYEKHSNSEWKDTNNLKIIGRSYEFGLRLLYNYPRSNRVVIQPSLFLNVARGKLFYNYNNDEYETT